MMHGVIWKSDWEILNRPWGWSYLKVTLEMMPWRYKISWLPVDSTTWGKGYPGVIQRNESRKEFLLQGQWKC